MIEATPQQRRRPMDWPRMRPRFILDVECGVPDVMTALRSRMPDNPRGIEGQLSERHGVLTLAEAEQRFWSTQLGLSVEDRAQGPNPEVPPTRVRGIFSPHPEIWTAFVFMMGTLAGLSVIGLIYGIVQLIMGSTPWALLTPVVTTLTAGLVYTSTLVGQGLAADEMYLLRVHVDECLAEAEARAATRAQLQQQS